MESSRTRVNFLAKNFPDLCYSFVVSPLQKLSESHCSTNKTLRLLRLDLFQKFCPRSTFGYKLLFLVVRPLVHFWRVVLFLLVLSLYEIVISTKFFTVIMLKWYMGKRAPSLRGLPLKNFYGTDTQKVSTERINSSRFV